MNKRPMFQPVVVQWYPVPRWNPQPLPGKPSSPQIWLHPTGSKSLRLGQFAGALGVAMRSLGTAGEPTSCDEAVGDTTTPPAVWLRASMASPVSTHYHFTGQKIDMMSPILGHPCNRNGAVPSIDVVCIRHGRE